MEVLASAIQTETEKALGALVIIQAIAATYVAQVSVASVAKKDVHQIARG